MVEITSDVFPMATHTDEPNGTTPVTTDARWRSLTGLSVALQALFGLTMAAALGLAVATMALGAALDDADGATGFGPFADAVDALDVYAGAMTLLQLVTLGAGVVFIVWMFPLVGATEPMAIVAAGGGAAAGVVVGGGIGGAVALAGVGWALAVVLPALRRGRRVDPAPLGPTDLREPWRQFVIQAQDAQRRFTSTVASVPAGPVHERLQRLGERIGQGVQEAGRVARRGQSLDDVRRDIDTFRIERQLDELEHEAPEPTVNRLRTADALRAQLATADRLDRILTATHDRLRFLAAHLGEAVARSFELSVETDGAAPIGEVDETLGDVIEEMEVLRQALDDTDLPGRATA